MDLQVSGDSSCGSTSLVLNASSDDGVINWYNDIYCHTYYNLGDVIARSMKKWYEK